MTVSRKRKRSISIDGQEFLWWIAEQQRYPYQTLLRVVTPEGSQFASFGLPLATDEELFPEGPPEQVTPKVVELLIRHRPRGDEEKLRYDALALDLEGTLVSNAVSQLPRAGLREFLDRCRKHVPRVVIYTAVAEPVFRSIARKLVAEDLAPDWFADIEYVAWSGPHKDLGLIPDCAPGKALLLDDNPDDVEPSQTDQWIRIPEFAAPYDPDDALDKAWDGVKSKYGKAYDW